MKYFKQVGSLILGMGILFIHIGAGQASRSENQRLLIRFTPEQGSRARIHSTLRALASHYSASFTEEKYLPLTETHVIEVSAQNHLEEIVENLRQNSAVAHVEIDERIQAHLTPNDPLFDEQWSLRNTGPDINADEAWEIVQSSEDVVVAIVDSGVDATHEDLIDNLWHNPQEIPSNRIDDDGNGYVDDEQGYDFLNRDNQPFDDFGHGTLVAGIIGASGDNQTGITGITWRTKLMYLKVLDSMGNSTISRAVEAIEYAISHGAKIINISWGYSPNGSPSQILEDAIRKAGSAGILVITSAGNGQGGIGFDNDANFQQSNYPSSYPEDNIIATAATDSSDSLARFSNFGAQSVDLAAPGVSILSTYPRQRYESFTGTSAGAPHITGAAALLWQLNPSLNYSQIKRLILETPDSVPSLQGKTLTGGRLNLVRAIQSSPAAGGNLLSTASPFPENPQAQMFGEGSAGGCRLQSGRSPLYFCWMGWPLLLTLSLFKRTKN